MPDIYIGSHVCKALAQGGNLPVTYDNMTSGHDWAMSWRPLEQGDVLDTARLYEVLCRHRPVAVMHFAAHIDPVESVAAPDKYFRNNVDGSASLLQALRQAGLKRLVFSSTAAVYGIPQSVPIAEDHPLVPISPYDESTLKVERLILEEAAIHGLKVAILRYFNAAGADYRSGIGESHEPDTHLIPRLHSAASGQSAGIVVNGTDYPTPDGTCIRDYIHVSDRQRRVCSRRSGCSAKAKPGSSISGAARALPCGRSPRRWRV